MNEHLHALFAVQEVDSSLAECARKLRALDNGAAEKERAAKLAEAHQALEIELRDARTALRDVELELEALEAKRKEHSERLYSGRIRNPKELDALQHEVEALGRRRAVLDERVLDLMERVENLAAREAEAKDQSQKARAAYRVKAEAYIRGSQVLRQEIERLQALRNERAAVVPVPLLRQYEAIRNSKGGVGIARVDGTRCGACRTNLPRNTLLSARDTASIVKCESCGRILYSP